MASSSAVSYTNKDFLSIRTDLINYVKQYYPDSFTDFTENDLGILFIELIAGLGDSLNYQIDRKYQETQLEFAQQRKSILSLAKNMGLKIPNKRGSVSIVDFTFTIPVKGDTYDSDYLPLLQAGTQVTGSGKVFEIADDVDFSSSLSNMGFPNRFIIPNIDANETVVSYTITKREVVYNGLSKIISKTIRDVDYKPFLKVTLPDNDVISVEQVLVLPGTNNPTPSINDFYTSDNTYDEVEYLLQDRVFIANSTGTIPRTGVWKKITKKFITEFTDKGFCQLTFGGGNGDTDLFNTTMASNGVYNGLDGYLQNTGLGEIPGINTQIFIRYSTGGGIASNVGANTLTGLGNVLITLNGPIEETNQRIKKTLKVNNLIPALGGADMPSIEQIRYMVAYNFSAQNRCVTLADYDVQLFKMPSRFGVPFRRAIYKENNKVNISILGIDSNGKLNNESTSLLQENIAEYLSEYRCLNDYVEIKNGKIFNLAYAFEIFIDEKIPSSQITLAAQKVVIDLHDINNNRMNQEIFIGDILEGINNVVGVINVISYKVYNKVGGQYSLNEIEQPYIDNSTREIQLIDNTIYSSFDSMFEIKFPNSDISFSLKKRSNLSR
jgi:hypothetical protein